MDANRLKGVFLALLATSCWASFYIVSRYFFGTDDCRLDPLWSSFLRYMCASGVFLLCIAVMGKGGGLLRALRMDWKNLLLMGLIGVAGESTLLFYSMKYTTAARSNLLTNISPVVTAIMSYFVTREAFGAKRIAGMLLGFAGMCGIFFLRGGDNFSELDASSFTGDAMAILAGICWSAYTVWGKRLVDEYGGLVAAGGSFLFGTAAMVPILLLGGAHVTLTVSARGWLMILYLGIVSNALANACWYAALKYLKPGELGAFGYVSVMMTFSMAVCWLGEKVSIGFMVCLAVILLGTGMMMKRTVGNG